MNYGLIPPVVAVAAALVSVLTVFPRRQDAVPQNRYRQMYDEASVDRDNVVGYIVRDHDGRADAMRKESQVAVEGRRRSAVSAPWDGGDLGAGIVTAARSGETTTIVTIENKKGNAAKTTFYLDDGKAPYLVVRERPAAGVEAPFVDRWYFEAGEYVTYRSSDPTQKVGTLQYTYTPTGKDDLSLLKAQLASALETLSPSRAER
jgi:hypothetical protein